LINTRSRNLPFAHKPADDPGASDDVTSPRAGYGNSEFANGQRLRLSKLGGLHFYLLIQLEQR
jgi:hypothetical protein